MENNEPRPNFFEELEDGSFEIDREALASRFSGSPPMMNAARQLVRSRYSSVEEMLEQQSVIEAEIEPLNARIEAIGQFLQYKQELYEIIEHKIKLKAGISALHFILRQITAGRHSVRRDELVLRVEKLEGEVKSLTDQLTKAKKRLKNTVAIDEFFKQTQARKAEDWRLVNRLHWTKNKLEVIALLLIEGDIQSAKKIIGYELTKEAIDEASGAFKEYLKKCFPPKGLSPQDTSDNHDE